MIDLPVCLIIPPSAFLLDERVFMTLGILKVAAVLEAEGVPIEMVDLSGIENYEDVISDHARVSRARCFGITATTPQMPSAVRIAEAVRATRPDARLILGGPHVTLVNAARRKETHAGMAGRAGRAADALDRMFDVLVAGDGEESIWLALAENAPKLIDADDKKSNLFLDNARLNSLPFPARHLLDVASYRYAIEGERATSLIAQLGCPFECGFCGGRSSPFLRKIRTRTSESVVEEMTHLHLEYGIHGFMMYDDELNVNPKMIELMRLIREAQRRLGVEWKLRGFIKAQLFTEEQAQVMYSAGFRWILVGFESGSERILSNINKASTLRENSACIRMARKHGLKVKALMSIGHPGESRDSAEHTRDWLLSTKPDDFDVTIITPYPGSPYYDDAVPDPDNPATWIYTYRKTGDRLFSVEIDYTKVAEYYKGDPDGGYRSYVYTDHLGPEELVAWRGEIERDVRERLSIPFNPSSQARRYEHSMGQSSLPGHILKTTGGAEAAASGRSTVNQARS